MSLTKQRTKSPSPLGRGRDRTWSPAAHQSSPRSRGRRAPNALRIVARVILWALLGTLVVRGAIPARPSHPRPPHPHESEAPPGVEAFAVGFATEYLTSGTNPSDRATRLAPYASSQLASNLEVVRDASPRSQRVEFAVPSDRRSMSPLSSNVVHHFNACG